MLRRQRQALYRLQPAHFRIARALRIEPHHAFAAQYIECDSQRYQHTDRYSRLLYFFHD
jgi:hypothetical protein